MTALKKKELHMYWKIIFGTYKLEHVQTFPENYGSLYDFLTRSLKNMLKICIVISRFPASCILITLSLELK